MKKKEMLISGFIVLVFISLFIHSYKPKQYHKQRIQLVYDNSTIDVLLWLPNNVTIKELNDGVHIFDSLSILFLSVNTEIYYFPQVKYIELNSANNETIRNLQ